MTTLLRRAIPNDRPNKDEFRDAAIRKYVSEGTLEIDKGATVSVSDDGGAYVQAWVWVYDTDITTE